MENSKKEQKIKSILTIRKHALSTRRSLVKAPHKQPVRKLAQYIENYK